jgi:NADH-quinone oxidoreductase subunit H
VFAAAIVFGVIFLGLWLYDVIQARRAQPATADGEPAAAEPAAPFDAFAGGYPVPPLPDQTRSEPVLVATSVSASAPAAGDVEVSTEEGRPRA